MKRICTIVFFLLAFCAAEWASGQVVTVYRQTFGNATSLPSGWTASGAQSTNITANTSSPSSGFTLPSGDAASGVSNVADGNSGATIGTAVLTVSNIVTTGFTTIKLSFGARKTSAYTGTVTLEWSSDGVTWNTISFTDVSNDAKWHAINSGTAISLPVGAENQANLRFRFTFVRTNTNGNYRIDDFTLYTGTAVSPSLVELVVPKYLAGNQVAGTNTSRTAIAACFQINNLTANTTYNIRAGFALTSDANNPGSILGLLGVSGSYVTASSNNMTSAFTTDGTGNSGPFWVYLQSSGNAKFNPATANLRIRIYYSTNTSFVAANSFQTSTDITPLDAGITTVYSSGTSSDDGGYLKLTSSTDFGGKYILIYNNTTGSGNPLFSYQCVSPTNTQSTQSELPTSIDNIYRNSSVNSGDAPAIIPLSTAVQRIEIRKSDNTIFSYFTKSDNTWDNGSGTFTNTTGLARATVQTISLLKGTYDDVGIYGNVALVGNTTVSGSLDVSSTSGLSIGSNTLTLNGTITNSSTLSGSSSSNLVIGGSSTSSLGTLNFASGGQTLNTLTINRNASPVLSMGTTLALSGSSGDVLQLLGSASSLDLNGQTFTLSGSGGNILTTSAAHTITGASGSTLLVSGYKTVTNSSGGSLVIDNNVIAATSTGIDFGAGLTTVNGTFRIDGGGYVNNNASIYGSGSLLLYNTNGTYNRSVEWGTTSGAGYPYNVQFSNNTILNAGGNFGASVTYAASIANNLTIDNGSALYMDYSGYNMQKSLIVGKNITINGNLSESGITGNDIYLGGDWTFNTGANFYPNSRAVFFNGTSAQSMGGTQTTPFDYLLNSNVSADVTMNGDASVSQKLTLQTGSVLALNTGTLTLNGTIDNSSGNAGLFSGTTSSKLTIGGSTNSVGTLNFKPGSMLLNTLTMSRTGVTGTAALIGAGTDLSVNTLKLNNGILTLGNNLFSASTVNGSSPASSAWVANTTEAQLQQSFVALCDASGNPITARDGSKGFRVTNLGTTETILPIGFDFNSTPNRMSLKNDASSTSDYYTVTMEKNDIQGTPLPMVNRIWYVSEGTTGGSNISMKLFFIKRNGGFGSTQDEVEDGFVWTDARLLHRVDDYPAGFANVSGGGTNGANDLSNFIGNANNTEVYAQYTFGNSGDNTGSQTANGIVDFSGVHKFSVANAGSIILPVTITNFNGYRQSNTVKLAWTSVNETNIDHYEIERSANNMNFVSIAKVFALNNGQIKINYSAADMRPYSGDNFYRLRIYDKAGKQSLSNTIKINFADNKTGIALYPNPIKGSLLYGDFSNIAAGNYNVALFNAAGKLVWQTKIEHAGGSWKYDLHLPQGIAKGIYTVKITGEKTTINTSLLVD